VIKYYIHWQDKIFGRRGSLPYGMPIEEAKRRVKQYNLTSKNVEYWYAHYEYDEIDFTPDLEYFSISALLGDIAWPEPES